jgi:pimeloyl-ACP methyl ester carboxylesterase
MDVTRQTPMEVVSADRTRIGVWVSGDGPALLMVHGAMADHTTLAQVVPLLEPHFTVHAMDRRGRGASGDSPTYTLEQEFADVAGVVDAMAERTQGPVSLYGHSFGATCALEAALRTPHVHRLALYEPAFGGIFNYPPGFLDRLTALVAHGEGEQAVELTFRERVGLSAAQVEALKALPSWTTRVAAAPTVPRELAVDATLAFDGSRYAAMAAPTLLLVGERTGAGQRGIVAAIDAVLPDSRIVPLRGQEHMAQATAPDLVANALIRFMTDDPGSRGERNYE